MKCIWWLQKVQAKQKPKGYGELAVKQLLLKKLQLNTLANKALRFKLHLYTQNLIMNESFLISGR